MFLNLTPPQKFQTSTSNFNIKFKLQLQTSASNFNSKFQLQTSTSNFNFKTQLQNSTSKLNFKIQLQLQTSTPNFKFKFKFQLQTSIFQTLTLSSTFKPQLWLSLAQLSRSLYFTFIKRLMQISGYQVAFKHCIQLLD